jgi:RimJ/RimL family protein N-acetyltransferase
MPRLTSSEIVTDRLLLRRFRSADLEPFARMNADERVMEFFPRRLRRAESDALASRIETHFEKHGFGLWALETKARPGFLGFVGLSIPSFEAPFTPCVEVGWRLSCESWGRGFATEAAVAALDFGFSQLLLEEIVSFTVTANVRSRAVMERLGMRHDCCEDFEHPLLAAGHPQRAHVLYRLSVPASAPP